MILRPSYGKYDQPLHWRRDGGGGAGVARNSYCVRGQFCIHVLNSSNLSRNKKIKLEIFTIS